MAWGLPCRVTVPNSNKTIYLVYGIDAERVISALLQLW